MKPGTNQKKWLAALRSGEFEQTVGCLQDSDGHCCLGVACDILATADELNIDEDNDRLHGEDLDSQPSVQKALGLRDGSGYPTNEVKGQSSTHRQALKYIDSEFGVVHDGFVGNLCLTRLNDSTGLTFNQIADLVEKFPELYFTGAK